MQNLLKNLKELLKKDDRLVSEDGDILKNKTIELALKLDKDLVELLMSDEKLKEQFFVNTGKATIFDKDKFIQFVSNKEFLSDSYTAFKNKIGLTDESGELISKKEDVALSWPYKDTVLEGGQTKEYAKREEIFYNETLAPDEISRLLEPKVFTNAKRIDAKEEKQLKKFNTDEQGNIKDNLIIKGNNLLALHSLKERFAGKVKLIYIDPPYNTGGAEDTFTYNNSFNHSTWLTFMKNRLEVAKEFIRDDGFIAITIDHEELFYLGSLADEIFGRQNRVGIVTIYINPKGRQHERFFSAATEYMLVYAKDQSKAAFNKVALDENVASTFTEEDEHGKYRLEPFIRARSSTSRENKPSFWYPIYVSPNLSEVTLQKKKGYHEVYPLQSGKEFTWKTTPETFKKRNKKGQYVAKKEDDGVRIYHKYYEQQVLKNIWMDKKYFPEFQGTNLLKDLLGGNLFSYPKSLYAVLDTLKLMTSDDDIIIDFFAGSGTTGHATLALNDQDNGSRKFILIEQLEKHIDVCTKRLSKVLEKGNSKENFMRMDFAEWNQGFKEQIYKIKNKKEAQKLWKTLKEKARLSYKIDPAKIDENAKEFANLSLEDQKHFLLETLDKNHLYINYSDIDDKEYGISEEDKKLNEEFYSK